ncbi:MAG: hypothetical protein AB1763_02540 [Campylobacterota bacterium]
MANDIVQGLSHFSDFFTDYKDDYIVIGGVATALHLKRYGATSIRATLDIDLIVLDDQKNSTFVDRMVEYVKTVSYQHCGIYKEETRILYQFKDPVIKDAPEQIELFTIDEIKDEKLTFIRLEGSEYYFYISAIVLNSDYRELIDQFKLDHHNLSIAAPEVLIPLKALAYVNLGKEGTKRALREQKKHLDDIKRLIEYVEEEKIEVSEKIYNDLTTVLGEVKKIRGREELADNALKVYVKKA